jgi:hypothetical protein
MSYGSQKISIYHANGQGRDSYIYKARDNLINSGTVVMSPRFKMGLGGNLKMNDNTKQNVPNRYVCNGTGRDTYAM